MQRTDFSSYFKPVDVDAVRQHFFEKRQRNSKRYMVKSVFAREGASASFVVSSESGEPHEVDLLDLPEGRIAARCCCKGYVLGETVCVHIQKSLLVARGIKHMALYVEQSYESVVERLVAEGTIYDPRPKRSL